MYDAPSTHELVTAVKRFIDEAAAPQLTGHAAFHALVASNVLATVLRELENGTQAAARERASLLDLLHISPDEAPSTDVLNRQLCDAIRKGNLTAADVLPHLKTTTIDQLSIDQPRYSGLKTALGE